MRAVDVAWSVGELYLIYRLVCCARLQDYRVSGSGGGSVSRRTVSASLGAGVGLTVLSLGAWWLVHRRRRRRAASAAAAAAEAADNDGRDANSTDNAAFVVGQ